VFHLGDRAGPGSFPWGGVGGGDGLGDPAGLAYAVVDVRVVAEPTNPADGERVVEVMALPPSAAADYLQAQGPIHADVVQHADALGLLRLRAEE
jgi:hypothetical protein